MRFSLLQVATHLKASIQCRQRPTTQVQPRASKQEGPSRHERQIPLTSLRILLPCLLLRTLLQISRSRMADAVPSPTRRSSYPRETSKKKKRKHTKEKSVPIRNSPHAGRSAHSTPDTIHDDARPLAPIPQTIEPPTTPYEYHYVNHSDGTREVIVEAPRLNLAESSKQTSEHLDDLDSARNLSHHRNDIDKNVEGSTDSSESSSESEEGLEMMSVEDLSASLDQLRGRLGDRDDKALIYQVERQMRDKDERLSKAVTTLMKMQDMDTGKKSDNHFINSVKTLRYAIKYWSISQKREDTTKRLSLFSSSSKGSRNNSDDIFRYLTSRYSDYLNTQGGLPKLLQAYIWNFLASRIFGIRNWGSYQRHLELGQVKSAFADFASRLYPGHEDSETSKEEFHQWRVTSSRLMYNQRLCSTIPHAAAQLAKELNEDLKLVRSSTASELVDIMQQALELDVDLSKQKAFFGFQILQPDDHFNPETMTDIRETEEGVVVPGNYRRVVGLVLAPSLYKEGDSEGKNYGTFKYLMRGEVVCR